MSDAVLVAIITAIVTVLGVILANAKSDAMTNNELRHLAEEVGLHNNFARRLPSVEARINELEKRIEFLEKNQRRNFNGRD